MRREGPHSDIVRDLCRTIYDQVASEQPLTTESIPNVDTTLHDKISAGASETVEVSDTFARASLVPDVVGTVATIVKVAGDKAGSVEAAAEAVADIANAFRLLVQCSRRSQLLRDAYTWCRRLIGVVRHYQDCTRSSLLY